MNTLNVVLYLAVIAISGAVGLLLIPQILRLCKRKGLYDLPDERKVHSNAIPRLGGISFVPALFISIGCLIGFFDLDSMNFQNEGWAILFLCGLVIMFLIGLADDLVCVPAGIKFIVQIICGIAFPLSGLLINDLYGFCGIYTLPIWFSWPLTVFVAVFTMNAVNLIDGIDGLAGCLTAMATLILGFLFIQVNLPVYALFAFALLGALLAFLRFNLWGTPEKNTKIFMGDTGSLTLGYILSFFCIRYAMNDSTVMPYHANALLTVFTILAVPALDVLRIVFLRMRMQRPLFKPDKNHIHHKFMRAGCTPRHALFLILGIAAFFCCLNFGLMGALSANCIIGIDIACWVLLHLYLDRRIEKVSGEKWTFFGRRIKE